MDIMCPHGKVVKPKNLLGIMVYEHLVGEACNLMNVFSTQADEVLGEMAASTNYTPSPLLKAAFKNSSAARMGFFIQLESQTEDELVKSLLLYVEMFEGEPETALAPLVETFGYVAIRNLEIVTGSPCSSLRTVSPSAHPLKMMSINDQRVAATIAAVKTNRMARENAIKDALNSL